MRYGGGTGIKPGNGHYAWYEGIELGIRPTEPRGRVLDTVKALAQAIEGLN